LTCVPILIVYINVSDGPIVICFDNFYLKSEAIVACNAQNYTTKVFWVFQIGTLYLLHEFEIIWFMKQTFFYYGFIIEKVKYVNE